MDIEEKRRIFLEKLNQCEPDILKFEKFSGPGTKRKIQRLIYIPNIYLPYVFWKFFRIILNDKKIKLFWGKEFFLNTKDLESSRLFYKTLGDEAELKLTKFFIKNLKEDDIFYDIGANYGFYSCLAAEFCKEVHLFEPAPQIFEYLKKNTLEYSNVFLNNLAVSNKNGIVEIYFDKKSSAMTTLNKNAIERSDFDLDKKEKTQVITLDEYIKNHSHPTIIKIDIEGGEKMAIEGGENFLRNESPIIAMEIWSQKNNGEISMEAVEKLKDYGYRSYFINRDGTLKEVEGDSLKIITLNLDNFIFKKIQS